MKRFTTVHRGDDASRMATQYIESKLIEVGFLKDTSNPELVVVIGGDGTLLNAFHKWLDQIEHLQFVGIHSGTLGFSTDYTINQLDDFIHDVQHHEPKIEEKRILKAHCKSDTRSFDVYALNEIRVENIVKTQEMDVFLNHEYFESFRGNGLCISGQYGSTAYNRSIAGAVIFPGLDLLQITEISGIHHRYARSLGSPLIVAPETCVTLKNKEFTHALLCYDNLHLHLDGITEIEISSHTKTMKFAHFNNITHIERLNALF